MKKNTKKIIAISTLSIAAIWSIPLGLTIYQKTNNNYFAFYSNNEKVYKNNEDDNSDFLLDGKNAEENAQIITLGFYKEALYGFNYIDEQYNEPKEVSEDSIMGQYPGYLGNVNIDINQVYNEYHKANTVVKLINDSKNEDSFSAYIATEAMNNIDQEYWDILLPVVAGEYKTFNDWFSTFKEGTSTTEEAINNMYASDEFRVIDESLEYDYDAAELIYQIMFLYQESSNSSFDYRLTEELFSQKLMFVWQADIHNASLLSKDSKEIIDGQAQISDVNDLYNNGSLTNINEGEVSKTNFDVEEDQIFSDIGYQGLQSKNNSTLNVNSNFWNYDNSWIIDPVENQEWSNARKSTFTNEFSEDSSNWWQESGSNINYYESSDESTSNFGDAYILHALSVYPFVFAQNYDLEHQTATKFNYSIEAIDNGNGTYSKIDENSNLENKVDLIDVIFGTDISQKEKEIYNVYIINSLVTNNSNLILNSQQYWRNRGYYIELSGEYQNIYGGYISQNLQEVK